MTPLLLAAALFLSPPTQTSEPDPARVKEVVAELESALKRGDKDAKVRALEAAGRVPAPAVIKAVARGFKDKEHDVKRATILALRFSPHPDALAALHRAFKSDRAIRKDGDLSGSILKAIGQHADPSSIKILTDDLFETRNYAAIKARILSLGRIRTKRAVEALLDLMKVTDQRTIDRYMGDFRLSLMILTGTDRGPSSAMWHRWWQNNKKTFEVAPEHPPISKPQLIRWARYWGTDDVYGRTKRREDRGDDPERRRRGRDRE